MPFYLYEEIVAGEKGGRRFEIFQKMSDPPLSVHPETGCPVRRVFTAFHSPANRYEKALQEIEREKKSRSNP